MKVKAIELIHLDIPFKAHAGKHLKYWLPHWRISQICRLTFDNGIEGLGETIPNYTWVKVPSDIEKRVKGRYAAELMWEDSLGAGVQMALFDGIAKAQGVPVYRLLGSKVRDWCPISWWNMDMPAKGWAEECRQAVKAGYMSAKLKARPWFDLHASIRAVQRVVPQGFHLDLDYNSTLANSANAVPHLKELEAYPEVAMIESPIPQNDVAGNRQIRGRINRPLAMHYGIPPVLTALTEDVTDGFVLNGGATRLRRNASVCEEANKPFWLQLVGTGITTAWAAHLGATFTQARWPAITCMNIWSSQLITNKHEIHGGFCRVPETPGLGIEIDTRALDRFRVEHDWVEPPRHLYKYIRSSGEVTYYACSKESLHQVFREDAQPICEPGSTTEVVEDNGSRIFQELYESALKSPVRRKEKRK